MRKTIVIIGILVFGLVVSVSAYYDAPHNQYADGVICDDCHTRPGFPGDQHCLRCHNTAIPPYSKELAPQVKTHSKQAIIDSGLTPDPTYGDWSVQCKDCHFVQYGNHGQLQYLFNGAASYLVQGTVTSITDNGNGTSTFGYTISSNRTGWNDFNRWSQKSGADRGVIIFPKILNENMSFEIKGATANTVTVRGSINTVNAQFSSALKLVVGDTFAITYGQAVRTAVQAPGGLIEGAVFFDRTGTNSFARDDSPTPDGTDPTPDGICQVCHTQTGHWKKDGTLAAIGIHSDYNGANCMQCHPHAKGFGVSGACNSCHGYPPTDKNVLGGPNGLASPATGSQTAGKHSYHATTLGMSCDKCHNGSIGSGASHNAGNVTLGFANLLGSSTVSGGTYNGQTGVTYNATVTNPVTTVNNSGGSTPNCTVYCHSNVQGANGVGGPSQYGTAQWVESATLSCDSCHGTLTAGSGAPASGRHQKHVSAPYNKGCNECHNGFGSGSAEHVNYSIGVAFQTNPGGGSGSYSNMPSNTPGTGYGTCSNVYCHSVVQGPGAAPLPLGAPQYKTPSWSVGVACGECHALPPSTGAHTLHANDGFVGYAFDCGSCHYQAGYFQGNPTPLHVNKQINIVIDPGHGATATYSKGTGFAPGAGSYGSCSASYCHSDGTSVKTGSIPANTSPNWGSSATCGSCHGGGNTTGKPSYVNSIPKANSHAKHSSDCSICHYATTTNGTAITSYANHANSAYNLQANAGQGYAFNYTFATGGCSSISCHFNGSATWGQSIPGGCAGCHLFPPASGSHAKHIQNGSLLTQEYGNTEVKSNGTQYAFGCGNCHPTDLSKHGNNIKEVTLNRMHGGQLKSKNDAEDDSTGYTQTVGTSVTCSAAYCHSDGAGIPTYKTTPNWYGGLFTNDSCESCHLNSPTGTSAHGAHVVGIHYDDIYNGTNGLEAAGGNTPRAGHGNAVTSRTINCDICHNNTIQVKYNAKNSVCKTCHTDTDSPVTGNESAVIASKVYHLNGAPDVAFAAATMLSKAQIRSIEDHPVAEWTDNWSRPAGYKVDGAYDQAVSFAPAFNQQTRTCNSVACHNGYEVNWDAPNITCFSCHKGLPR